MADYTLAELADVNLFYGEIHSNSQEAKHLCVERFPGWRLQKFVAFQRLDFEKQGSLHHLQD